MFKKIKTILKKKPVSGKEEDKQAVSVDSSPLKSGKTAPSEKESVQKKPAKKADQKSAEPVNSKTVESKTSSPGPSLKDKKRAPAASSKEQVSAKSLGAARDSLSKDSVSAPAAGEKSGVESKSVTPLSKSESEAEAPLKPKTSPPPAKSQSATQEKTAPSKAKSEEESSTAPRPKPEKSAVAKSGKDVAVQPEAQTGLKTESPSTAPETESKMESPSTAPETESKVRSLSEEASQRKKEETPQRETVKLQGLFAFKRSMTSFYDDNGFRVPVTALKYEPWVVSQIKTSEKEGYSSVQLAGLPQKNGRCKRPLTKHLAPAGFREGARFLREIRQELPEGIKVGQELSIESLKKGDRVQISSRSKGRGFSGTVKRWGFHGGPASHGSKTHRKTGSIGQCAEPARVMPGRKMPGRYGFQKITLNSVLVVDVLPAEGMIFIKGPVSGARNTLVSLRKTGEDHA